VSRLYVAAAAVVVLSPLVVWLVLYVRATPSRKLSKRMALRVRFGWLRLSQLLGLFVADPTPRLAHIQRLLKPRKYRFPIQKSRVRAPRLSIRTDEFGLVVSASTLPKVGLAEWTKNADHLSNAWGAVRVTVAQERPGRIRVRAVHRDPLIEPTQWHPTGAEPSEEDWRSWQVGRDEYAQEARLPLANVPGAVVAGLPGSGKTSLIGGQLLSRYAPSKKVAFIVIDGKGSTDYGDWAPRCARFCDDDLERANEIFRDLTQLRQDRQRTITLAPEFGGLGTKNFWNASPSEAWPLVCVVIDEAHTFFEEIRGNDSESKARAALTAENRRLVSDLVKKGRSAGLFTILASQKPTSDSVPTSIRDVCPVLASFAQTTSAAARAALGDDISEYPDANPINLQGPDLVGVMVTKVQGRPGFSRLRTPYVPELEQERIARETAGMRVDPWALVPARLQVPEIVSRQGE
jgi:S-DNA-T family DNA segregation ATPase FtsK/SpoIIIE